MNYYISDLHCFHANIITKLDGRPFKDLDEMHRCIIKRWNARITDNDDIYILGDFSFGNAEDTMSVLKKLDGKKHLIKGNHDHKYLNNPQFDKSLFVSIKDYDEITDNGRRVILSHYPNIFYNHQYRGAYMLYGHIHDTQDARMMEKIKEMFKHTTFQTKHGEVKIPFNLINCFCGYSDYTPLMLDEWIAKQG